MEDIAACLEESTALPQPLISYFFRGETGFDVHLPPPPPPRPPPRSLRSQYSSASLCKPVPGVD